MRIQSPSLTQSSFLTISSWTTLLDWRANQSLDRYLIMSKDTFLKPASRMLSLARTPWKLYARGTTYSSHRRLTHSVHFLKVSTDPPNVVDIDLPCPKYRILKLLLPLFSFLLNPFKAYGFHIANNLADLGILRLNILYGVSMRFIQNISNWKFQVQVIPERYHHQLFHSYNYSVDRLFHR